MASYQQHSGYPLQVSVQRDPEPRTRSAHIMPTTLMLHPAALQVTETNVIAPTEVDKRTPVVPRSASPKYPVIPTTVDIDGLGRLTPGALYSIPDAALPTAQAILNQTYTVPAGGGAYAGAGPRWYSFAIVPRRPEYSGGPSLPMLAFSVDGLAGVPLRALRDLTADDIDGAGDKVWDSLGWKKTSLSIDVRGFNSLKFLYARANGPVIVAGRAEDGRPAVVRDVGGQAVHAPRRRAPCGLSPCRVLQRKGTCTSPFIPADGDASLTAG